MGSVDAGVSRPSFSQCSVPPLGQSGRSAGIRQGRLGLVCPPRRASSWLLLLYSRVVMSDPSPLPLLLVGVASPCSAPTRRMGCLRLRPPDEAPGQPLAETRAMSRSLSNAPTANVLRSGPNLLDGLRTPPATRRGGAVSGRARGALIFMIFHFLLLEM